MTESVKPKRRNPNVYTLEFDDSNPEEIAGLVVRTKGPTLSQLFEIAELGKIDLKDMTTEGLAAIKKLTLEFPDRIIAWNYETEEGVPLPPTADIFCAEEWTFTLPVVQAWMQCALKDPRVQKRMRDIQGEIDKSREAIREHEDESTDDENALASLNMS